MEEVKQKRKLEILLAARHREKFIRNVEVMKGGNDASIGEDQSKKD